MGNRLFVGNLSYNTSEQELRDEFTKCGTVKDLRIITDRETGRSKGFGFVQFATEAEAQVAIQALDGQDLAGRTLAVRVAEERPARPQGQGPGPMQARPSHNKFGPPKAKGGGSYEDYNRKGRKDKKRRRRDEDSDWR